MEGNSKFREWINSVTERLSEQQWYQELQGKWEELDPQSRLYLKFVASGAGILILLLVILTSIWSVHRLKTELSEKRTLLTVIQTANDELRRLKETTPQIGSKDKEGPWSAYFESLATNSGIDKSSVVIASEKLGNSGDQAKEALFDINLKHVNIKQVVRFAFATENGQRPAKIRNLTIDTKSDPTGYLDATLALSAFTLVEPK